MTFLSAVHVYLSCVWNSWLKYIFIYHAVSNTEIAEKGMCIWKLQVCFFQKLLSLERCFFINKSFLFIYMYVNIAVNYHY